MNFLADVYLIPAKRERSTPMISESDFDLVSKLGTKHYVPKILKKVKFAGGGGGDGVGEAVEGGDDGGDTYIAGDSPGPNTPVAGRSRAPTAAADAEEAEPTPAPRGRHRSQSRLRFESTAAQQPPSTDAPPPSRSRSKSKGAPEASGSITGFHLRQNVGAAATALMRGATGAVAAVAKAFPKPAAKSTTYTSALGAPLGMTPYMSTEGAPRRGRSPTPKPRNIIFDPGSPPPAAKRSQSRKDTPMPHGARSRAASAASQAGGGGGGRRGLNLTYERTSPVRGAKEAPKPAPPPPPAKDELEIHAIKPVAAPINRAHLFRRTQSQAPPKAAPLSLYGTLNGNNVIIGARGGLTVETATGNYRSLTAAEKAQVVKKTA